MKVDGHLSSRMLKRLKVDCETLVLLNDRPLLIQNVHINVIHRPFIFVTAHFYLFGPSTLSVLFSILFLTSSSYLVFHIPFSVSIWSISSLNFVVVCFKLITCFSSEFLSPNWSWNFVFQLSHSNLNLSVKDFVQSADHGLTKLSRAHPKYELLIFNMEKTGRILERAKNFRKLMSQSAKIW